MFVIYDLTSIKKTLIIEQKLLLQALVKYQHEYEFSMCVKCSTASIYINLTTKFEHKCYDCKNYAKW